MTNYLLSTNPNIELQRNWNAHLFYQTSGP